MKTTGRGKKSITSIIEGKNWDVYNCVYWTDYIVIISELCEFLEMEYNSASSELFPFFLCVKRSKLDVSLFIDYFCSTRFTEVRHYSTVIISGNNLYRVKVT